MTTGQDTAELKQKILQDPEAVLSDRDVMRALVSAEGGPGAASGDPGRRVVDLRSVLVARLETRLDRLEDTHRSVIAAAYENLAGTKQVHRAVLALLDCESLEDIIEIVEDQLPLLLSVDRVRIGIEESGAGSNPVRLDPGTIDDLFRHAPGRDVLLCSFGDPDDPEDPEGSEALVRLDLGPEIGEGLLVFSADDPRRFGPEQATDLLTFFGAVFARVLCRALA